MNLSLVQLIVVTLVVGLLLWLLNNYVPVIDGAIKKILNVVAVVVVVILWVIFLLNLVGLSI